MTAAGQIGGVISTSRSAPISSPRARMWPSMARSSSPRPAPGFTAGALSSAYKRKKVAVRFARRRTRTAVSGLAEIVAALAGAVRPIARSSAGSPAIHASPAGMFHTHPMSEGAAGSVGIVKDQGERLGVRRGAAPGQLRGGIRAVAGFPFWEFAAGRNQFTVDLHGSLRSARRNLSRRHGGGETRAKPRNPRFHALPPRSACTAVR